MTILAAGILFIAPGELALFLKRGAGGDYPGLWCFPGGRREGEESAEETAKRETIEEVGSLPNGERSFWTRSIMPVNGPIPATPTAPAIAEVAPSAVGLRDGVDFTTFVQRVSATFEPILGPASAPEHTGWAWSKITEPPEPLHPGCRVALVRFSMDELAVARAIAAGELTSPQTYKNVTLFALRITGTGVAYRNKSKEFVYRRPEEYLNDEFLARCNGLTVIMIHPPKDLLDSKEFAKRVVGSIMLPYIKGDEVWGIAKIYDDAAVKLLDDYQLSTSPGVLIGKDSRLVMVEGEKILIEGKPELLDHLAILPPGLGGVWDKGEGPTGVESVNAQADAARLDANDKLDVALEIVREAQLNHLCRRLKKPGATMEY